MVDAMDGYSTMCKKAYSVCGHYNDSTITGSSPVLTTMSIIDKKQKPLATGTFEQEVAEINLLLTEVTTRLEGLGLRLVCSLKEEQTQSDNNAPLLKESSVEWLINELDKTIPYQHISTSQIFTDIIEQAREMHKDEIMDAYMTNRFDYMLVKDFEHYYNETYGGNNEQQ